MNPPHCGNQYPSRSEYSFYYRMRSFARRSQFADQPVPFFIKFTQRRIRCSANHGKVVTSSMHTEISSISDDDLSFDRQINLAIMHLCGSGLHFTNEAVIDIAFLVKLVAKIALFSF